MENELLLTEEEITQLIKETGWGLKRAESLNLVSNYTTVAEAQLAKVKQHYEQKIKDAYWDGFNDHEQAIIGEKNNE